MHLNVVGLVETCVLCVGLCVLGMLPSPVLPSSFSLAIQSTPLPVSDPCLFISSDYPLFLASYSSCICFQPSPQSISRQASCLLPPP